MFDLFVETFNRAFNMTPDGVSHRHGLLRVGDQLYVQTPADVRRSAVIGALYAALARCVGGGRAFLYTAFQLASGLYLADVACVGRARAGLPETGTHYPCAPDLAVFVDAPGAPTPQRVIRDFGAGGARLVWRIDADRPAVEVYRAGSALVETLHEEDTLDGADVIPGFAVQVRDLFAFD